MIEILPGKYESDLLEFFWTYKPKDEEDQKVTNLLNRICHACLVDRNQENQPEIISNISLTEVELNLIKRYNFLEHPNLEVRIRGLAVTLRFLKGKVRIEKKREVSDGYLKLYKETKTIFFLVRSFELRNVKVLYDESFLKEFKDVVLNPIVHPGWMIDVLKRVITNVECRIENPYVKDVLSVYANIASKENAYWRDAYYDMLGGIGAIEDFEWHYKKALNWEEYADSIEKNKKENVINPNLHIILQDSFKQIFQIKDLYPDDYKRIRDKYNIAKRHFVEALPQFGSKIQYEVPKSLAKQIHEQIAVIQIKSVQEAICNFLCIPFYTADDATIDYLLEKSMRQSPIIEKLFSKSQTLDREGNISGVSNFEEGKRLHAHRFVRASLIYHIQCLFNRIGEHPLDYSEFFFYNVLSKNKPSFIEEDRIQIWAKAYDRYFNNDIVMAIHLLMPQFEHALHNLLEEIVDDVTLLNNDVQKEPTLVGILNQLKPYCNSALIDELNMLFVDGNDVNFRNRLLHGLMGPIDMLYYGHYLFYLSNLLYFRGKKFLHVGE